MMNYKFCFYEVQRYYFFSEYTRIDYLLNIFFTGNLV
jgi:hypothetical protein